MSTLAGSSTRTSCARVPAQEHAMCFCARASVWMLFAQESSDGHFSHRASLRKKPLPHSHICAIGLTLFRREHSCCTKSPLFPCFTCARAGGLCGRSMGSCAKTCQCRHSLSFLIYLLCNQEASLFFYL